MRKPVVSISEFHSARKGRTNPEPPPQPTDPAGNGLPRVANVIDAVAEDMAHRWFDRGTCITTIRRVLNVSLPEAQGIVRKGMALRANRRAAA